VAERAADLVPGVDDVGGCSGVDVLDLGEGADLRRHVDARNRCCTQQETGLQLGRTWSTTE